MLAGNGATISFTGNASANFVSLPNSSLAQVTLDLDDNTLTVNAGKTGATSLTIESTATNPNNRVTLNNGTLTLGHAILMQQGAVANVNSQLVVSGTGAVLNTTWGTSIIGFFGRSEVIVENGGVWNNIQDGGPSSGGRPDVDIGLDASDPNRFGEGLLRVTGAGSTYEGSTAWTDMDGQPRIRVGAQAGAKGAIEILEGGTFNADLVNFAEASTAIGTALISGSGSSYTTKYTYLGGLSPNAVHLKMFIRRFRRCTQI